MAEMMQRPEVQDAMVTDANYLYLAVPNNGSDWTGYAASVCDHVRQRGVTSVYAVKMVDAAMIQANRGFKEIGKAFCS